MSIENLSEGKFKQRARERETERERGHDRSSILSGVEFYELCYKISSVNCFIKMGAQGTGSTTVLYPVHIEYRQYSYRS